MRFLNKICLGLFFLSLQLFFLTENSLAQQGSAGVVDYNRTVQFITDVSGKPLQVMAEYQVEGSPLFPEQYYSASIMLRNGKTYDSINAKLNLVQNELLFLRSDGTEMTAIGPIQRIVFSGLQNTVGLPNTIFEKNFPAIDRQNEESYYEVLDTGKLKFLKYHKIIFEDKKSYGSATPVRVFQESDVYYLFLNGAMKKIDKGKEAILSLLPSHKEEMSKFIDANGLKCRKESDWEKIVVSYNSMTAATN